jgi:hypothetical protein
MEVLDYDLSDDSELSSVPSVPSSLRSSPEPATRYLTPSSQDAEDSTRQDCPPPAKKRRRNPLPKERTTQYLYLSKSSYEQQDQVKLLVDTLRHQKDIVAIAGAGISTSAGSKFFAHPSPVPACYGGKSKPKLTATVSSRFSLHRWSIQVFAEEAQPESFWKAPLRCCCLPG